MPDRWITLDGLVNMRDLGGLPTVDGGRVQPRRLIRSDDLQDLTDADVDRLVDELGVTDVVDLRTETELHLEPPGPLHRVEALTHHHHSLVEERRERAAQRTAERAVASRTWADHYLGYLSRRADAVSAALRVVAAAEGATVVHCAAGKDRTGTVVALALEVAGVPREEVVADYVLSAERIEQIVDRLRTRPFYDEVLAEKAVDEQRPRAESVEAMLAAVDEGWGGATGWLRAHGWSTDDVTRLRDRLTR